MFDSVAQARAVPSGQVELVHCGGCGLIYNAHFDAKLGEVGARYESSQAASAHFGQFARSLSQAWIERYALSGKTVLEIGCGQGEFLRQMLADGIAAAVGLDPLADPHPVPGEKRITIRAERFDATTLSVDADADADAVVCRHTLEHVPRVAEFLSHLAQWARRGRDRVVLFEVPAVERVLAECAFWDVYYEHCSYFTAASLAHAFEAAGFDVLRLEPVYGDQYLILEARLADPRSPREKAPVAGWGDCTTFGRDAGVAIANCDRHLEALAAGRRPLVLWQGAAKTVGFLSTLANAGLIHSAVDVSPHRQGKFLPGSGLPVHAPAELAHIAPAHVVLMNPIYLGEVGAELARLGVASRLLTVNDLCAARF